MTDHHPRTFRLTLVVLGCSGLLLFGWAAARVPTIELVAFLLAGLVLGASPARLRDDVVGSLSTVGIFTAMIVGGAPLAVVASAGAGLACALRPGPRRLAHVVYNLGQFSLAGAASALVFEAVAGPGVGLAGLGTRHGLVALALSALICTAVNHLLVGLAVRLTAGDPLRQTLRGVLGTSLLLQYLHLGLAVVAAALIVELHPFALVLLVVPALVARQGLLGFQAQAEAYDRLVNAFVKVIEVKDPYTRGHADRVATLSEAIAGDLGHDYDARRLTRYAAVLHDVGKVAVPTDIINKPGALTDEEREVIKRHPSVGAEMLRDITFLQPVIDIVRCHHERLDGQGYPAGLGAEHLSPLVRIVTAADAFDAMTSTRSYRRALAVEDAIQELRRHAGTQFDPEVVEALDRTVTRLGWTPTVAFASAQEVEERAARRADTPASSHAAAPRARAVSGAKA